MKNACSTRITTKKLLLSPWIILKFLIQGECLCWRGLLFRGIQNTRSLLEVTSAGSTTLASNWYKIFPDLPLLGKNIAEFKSQQVTFQSITDKLWERITIFSHNWVRYYYKMKWIENLICFDNNGINMPVHQFDYLPGRGDTRQRPFGRITR